MIDAMVAVAPELKELLAPARTSATFAAPENAPLFWAEAQEVLQAAIGPEHPKFKELLAIWIGRGPAPDRRHVFIYLFTNGTIKTSRAGGALGDPKPRLGPAHGAMTILEVTPEGRCVIRKDLRPDGYEHGHVLDEVRGLRLGELGEG
ncbi:MAG: hypothetical protein AB7W59_00385 [Acidimicrobiia bacterium]